MSHVTQRLAGIVGWRIATTPRKHIPERGYCGVYGNNILDGGGWISARLAGQAGVLALLLVGLLFLWLQFPVAVHLARSLVEDQIKRRVNVVAAIARPVRFTKAIFVIDVPDKLKMVLAQLNGIADRCVDGQLRPLLNVTVWRQKTRIDIADRVRGLRLLNQPVQGPESDYNSGSRNRGLYPFRGGPATQTNNAKLPVQLFVGIWFFWSGIGICICDAFRGKGRPGILGFCGFALLCVGPVLMFVGTH